MIFRSKAATGVAIVYLLLVGGGLVNALLLHLAVGAVASLIGRTGKP